MAIIFAVFFFAPGRADLVRLYFYLRLALAVASAQASDQAAVQ
jgi:hypothetical protein